MREKPYIENLLDFADEVARRMDGLDDFFRPSYLMSLVYVEDILDKYGRVPEWIGEDPEYRAYIVERMEQLRSIINSYSQMDEFQEAKRMKAEQFNRDWSKKAG